MWETWVRSLGWEDSLEERVATYSNILAWRIPMNRGAWQATVHKGCKELDTTERASTDLEKYCASADILPSARGLARVERLRVPRSLKSLSWCLVNQAWNCLASEFPVSWGDVYAFLSCFEIGFVLVLVKSLVTDLKVKVVRSCPTLCTPMGYTVHGILQARILEWIAFPFSSGSSQPRDWTQVSCIAGRFFTSWATREALQLI